MEAIKQWNNNPKGKTNNPPPKLGTQDIYSLRKKIWEGFGLNQNLSQADHTEGNSRILVSEGGKIACSNGPENHPQLKSKESTWGQPNESSPHSAAILLLSPQNHKCNKNIASKLKWGDVACLHIFKVKWKVFSYYIMT